MNAIGKMLVLINLALSLLMLGWALTVYFHPIDWGHNMPRKAYLDPPKSKSDAEPNVRKAPEAAKHLAALQRDVNARPRAEANLDRALRNRDSLRRIFAKNHLEYVAEVEKLERGGRRGWSRRWDDIEIRELKYDDNTGLLVLEPRGMTVLDAAGAPELDDKKNPVVDDNRRIGGVVYDKVLPTVNKSYAAYAAELDQVLMDIKATSERIKGWIEKEEKLTVRVNGTRDKAGKFIVPGYYDLYDLEKLAQARLGKEIEYVQPLWVRELVNAQLLLERSRALRRRLQELGDKNVVAAK
jgi:hypothetical protein